MPAATHTRRTVRSLRMLWMAALVLTVACAAQAAPFNVYLLWNDDPTTSIVVNFHSEGQARKSPDPQVHYDTQSRGGTPTAYASHAKGVKSEIPELPVDRTLNAVPLTGLQPNTTYFFVAGTAEGGYTEERSFRTIPAGDEPFRFVTGGDMNITPRTEKLLAEAGKKDPLFCAIGGDIAYENGRIWEYATYDRWFENYDKHLRAPDGRMIPMFVAIGNHETNDYDSNNPTVKAPFYTFYFSQVQSGGKPYFSRKIGKNILFIALDSGHIVQHGGEQSAWLAETLAASQDVRCRFAIYHVPLYPSMRPYEGEGSRLGRVHWEPYFSAYHLTTAFENHDHTLKRSKRLLNGQPAKNGVLYLGDGSFGVEPRKVEPALRPYLEVQAGVGHVWVADVHANKIEYQAVSEDGKILDRYTLRLK